MTSTLNALGIRRRLNRNEWGPPRPFGPDGWILPNLYEHGHIIATCSVTDGVEWVHASIAFKERMPTYEEIRTMHLAVFNDGHAYEVHTPKSEHVNIHDFARHLWGRKDGKPALPDFTHGMGMI